MSLKEKLKRSQADYWNLAFIEGGFDVICKNKEVNFIWLKHKYTDRWFADPFILSVDEKQIVVLVEEFRYDNPVGRIAKLIIGRHSYELLSMEVLLDLPTHLSFPFIYRKGDSVYIIPENSQSGASYIYKYDINSDTLGVIKAIVRTPLTDATICNYKNREYLVATKLPNPNGNEMLVFEWNDDELKAETDNYHVIRFSGDYARNAGAVFEYNGIIVRPAQDCNKVYGGGVVFHSFSPNEKDDSNFERFVSLYPQSFVYNQGIHTFNQLADLAVVDGRGFYKPFLGRIVYYLFSLYNTVRRIFNNT